MVIKVSDPIIIKIDAHIEDARRKITDARREIVSFARAARCSHQGGIALESGLDLLREKS